MDPNTTTTEDGQINNTPGDERVAAGSAAGAAHVDNVVGEASQDAPSDGHAMRPAVTGNTTDVTGLSPADAAKARKADQPDTVKKTGEPTQDGRPGQQIPADKPDNSTPSSPVTPSATENGGAQVETPDTEEPDKDADKTDKKA